MSFFRPFKVSDDAMANSWALVEAGDHMFHESLGRQMGRVAIVPAGTSFQLGVR